MANSIRGKPLPHYLESSCQENGHIFLKLGDSAEVGLCGGVDKCCSMMDGP